MSLRGKEAAMLLIAYSPSFWLGIWMDALAYLMSEPGPARQ